MLNQKRKHKESARQTKAEKKIEDFGAEVEKILERLRQIEGDEPWMKTWRTYRQHKKREDLRVL